MASFRSAITWENRDKGIFAAYGYTSDGEQECATFFNRTGRFIKLLTVQEILDEEYVQNMQKNRIGLGLNEYRRKRCTW